MSGLVQTVTSSPTTGVGKFIKGMGGPGAVLGLGASLIGGFLGAGQARRARREAQKEAKRLQNKCRYIWKQRFLYGL